MSSLGSSYARPSQLRRVRGPAAEIPPSLTLQCGDNEVVDLTSVPTPAGWRCAGSLIEARVAVGAQMFDLPPTNSTVTFSAIVEEGGGEVPEVTIARADDAIAIQIDHGLATGDPSAVRVLEANSSNVEHLQAALQTDFATKCSTVGQVTAYNGRWESRDFRWWYNPTDEPSTAAATSLVSAADTIAGGESTLCGNRPNNANVTYLGRIFFENPQVLANGGCGTFSTTNTVGWGPFDNASTLAAACTWRSNGFITKSDIKFDTSGRTWNTDNACNPGRFDVQGIATHEFGHSVGLGHVFQESQQVMKPASPPCDLDQRELGWGDQRNLIVAYG